MTKTRRDQITFDEEFLKRLREREPETCTRFVFHFTPILNAKLRYEASDYSEIDDLRNETFYRVIVLNDRCQIREACRFGAFVYGVCLKVAQEHRGKRRRDGSVGENTVEPSDTRPLIDELLQRRELTDLIREELMKLSEDDRKLIVEDYFEGRDRQAMAAERGVTAGAINVRLCRALKRFKVRVRGSWAGKG